MKSPFLMSLAMTTILSTAACTQSEAPDTPSKNPVYSAEVLANPVLAPWDGPFSGVPPWDQVEPASLGASLSTAMELASAEIEAIANADSEPSFENTIIALEKSGAALDRASSIFGVYASNLNLGPVPDILAEMSPKFAAYSDSITQNENLFARIKSVYGEKEALNTEQARLVDDYYQGFVRAGATLSAQDKEKMSELNSRLASLTNQFGQNVLDDEQGYTTYIETREELAGLPDWLIDNMANAAAADDRPGAWAIANTRSAMDPFLTYADNRALRETVWNTYYNRGDNGDERDNNAIISEILQIRDARAKLLGFPTHAHWKLENQMAKTPQNAIDLMEKVWPYAIARAKEEVADMQAIADSEGAVLNIEPWDYRYYAEKVRKDRYDLDSNEIKPYLEMENLREAMFYVARRLFGLSFTQVDNVPVFHDDVRVWEVKNQADEHVGLWYFDPYARDGKRSGAWMTSYRSQHKMDGGTSTIIVSNNSNFVKGKPGEPVLISWDDATTMFHEFGHALHGLNSNVTYPSLSGTSVSRDYVEFPSQLLEHWLSTPEVLNTYALHAETGEPIPQALLDKIKNAETFNQGFATTEYLASALIDMKLHMAGGDPIDADAFERETLAALGMPSEIVMRHRTPHFGHIFSSGYHAGYYSYLWAETLTADAAESFEEAGSFYDEATAAALKEHIFSKGNTVDPADAFRAFRGRDVHVDALMRQRGFIQ